MTPKSVLSHRSPGPADATRQVCKPYVAGLCLSEIFTNTKLDLGTCPRAHSNKLRLEFNSLYAKAEEEKDLPKLAELNRLKVEYENTVRPRAPS